MHWRHVLGSAIPALLLVASACGTPRQATPGSTLALATPAPSGTSAPPATATASLPPEAVSATAEANGLATAAAMAAQTATAEAKGLATAAALGAQTATAAAKEQATAAAIAAVTATYEAQPVLTAVQVFKDWDSKTALQKPIYESSLVGMRIQGTGTVNEIYESGYVLLNVPNTGVFQRVSLYDIPKTVLATLNKSQAIRFDGKIRKFSNSIGQSIEVGNTQILP
jgi:hypothetical protein